MAKPAKDFSAVVATANALASGAVVYRAADGQWSHALSDAHVARSKHDADILLQAGEGDVANRIVVDLALIEVESDGSGMIRPRTLRERIRAEGPTIPIPVDHQG